MGRSSSFCRSDINFDKHLTLVTFKFLAGEHTSIRDFGTINGEVESGFREADRILGDLYC